MISNIIRNRPRNLTRNILMGLIAVGTVSFSAAHNHTLCEGFVPENDLYIADLGIHNAGGISKEAFNQVLDRIEEHMTDSVTDKGARLEIKRLWSDGTVNASAQQFGSRWVINMYGGLARHKTITEDGFAIVACHELGHHMGGAPKYGGFFGNWASNEGQSDYYAALKCMRMVFSDEENLEYAKSADVPTAVREKCDVMFADEVENAACVRSSIAAMSVSRLFQELREENSGPSYDTPDQNQVSRTSDRHPGTQCRLDTYFSGALCNREINDSLHDTDPLRGTCNRVQQFENGVRPRCWYKP